MGIKNRFNRFVSELEVKKATDIVNEAMRAKARSQQAHSRKAVSSLGSSMQEIRT